MDIPEESASILQKIEKDLLSIKDELTALKNEISSLRSKGPKIESEESRDEAEPGFFEEDEDETIALTGDELDNILNTADITEHTGQSTAVSPEDGDLVTEEREQAEQPIIDREDVIFDEEDKSSAETADLALDDTSDELMMDESLADLASITEEPTEVLSLEEEATSTEEKDLLDLPEEEEIVLEEISESDEPGLEKETGEPAEPEVDTGIEDTPEEMPFELDEELQLSPSEQKDLEASQDLLGEEELIDLGEPDVDETELAEMESEVAQSVEPDIDEASVGDEAPESAEQSVEEAFELADEKLEPLEEETPSAAPTDGDLPDDLKSEIRAILKYMDQLLESLPEEKIEEFANSEYFDVYKRLFEELDLAT
jgi:hypothetical protein